MINVWFDWNCIIGFEIERGYSPALRQLREWYRQGKLVLCLPSTIRMEKHPSPDKTHFDENELNEKLRAVGVRISIPSKPTARFFSFPGLQEMILREIHDRVNPSVAFSENDHAEKQRHMGKRWNNRKNDALSIYTFATWSGADDVFVSADYGDIIGHRDRLYEPYRIWVKRPMQDPNNPNLQILKGRREDIPGHIVIPGHILDPQEAEKYLRNRLEG